MRVGLNTLLVVGLGLAVWGAVAGCESPEKREDGGPLDAGGLDAGSDGGEFVDAGYDGGPDAGPPGPYGKNCSGDQDKTGLVVRSGRYGTDGLTHDYYSYVPSSYDSTTPIPVIVSLHGAGDNAQNFVNLWEADADSAGFMVLVPEGSAQLAPGAYTWNTTDTTFIIGTINDIDRCYHTDLHRHIIHGFSAGGFLAYILGLSDSLRFSGIAIASSDLGTAEYYWGRSLLPSDWKIPASLFHGTQDMNFPIAQTGEVSKNALLAAGHVVYWHPFNGGHTTNPADSLQMWEDLKNSTSP